MNESAWTNFRISGSAGAAIALAQVDETRFELGSTIEYLGEFTGLEGKVRDSTLTEIRVVTPATLPITDLASVPAPLQWFVNRYGKHTPAALIHDRLIGATDRPDDLTDAYADRYFRFMLEALGVRWIRRWLMWAATALRSRFAHGGLPRLCIILWVVASTVGTGVFGWGLSQGDGCLLLAAGIAPVLFAPLWGRQYGAGLVAAYTAAWVLPPTLFGALGYWIYLGLEALAERLRSKERPS